MGFWDREVEDSFDEMFDINRDGFLDAGEEGLQIEYLNKMSERPRHNDYADDPDYDDLDIDALEMMNEDERRDALEDAGYDPDDFDL